MLKNEDLRSPMNILSPLSFFVEQMWEQNVEKEVILEKTEAAY
jgi:hypothetical protein